MLIDQLICCLVEIKQKYGNIPVFLTDSFDHHDIRWVDYMEELPHFIEHVCIRIEDKKTISNKEESK